MISMQFNKPFMSKNVMGQHQFHASLSKDSLDLWGPKGVKIVGQFDFTDINNREQASKQSREAHNLLLLS